MSRREDRMPNADNPAYQPQKQQSDPSKKQKQDPQSQDQKRERPE